MENLIYKARYELVSIKREASLSTGLKPGSSFNRGYLGLFFNRSFSFDRAFLFFSRCSFNSTGLIFPEAP